MTTDAEDAVRRYLAWIDDPSSIVDHEAVAAAEAAFAAATDPIDRLHAAAALERSRSADASVVEDGFVRHAKAYADEASIPAAAFTALGVGHDVLGAAGFGVASVRGRASGPARSVRAASGGARAPQVSVGALKAVAVQMAKRFTLAQLAAQAGGGSPATVRKAVEELIADGRAISVGPDADHQGRGRAPTLYELV